MTRLPCVKTDGGRAAAGFSGSAGDCVVRAIALALALPYREVYEEICTIATQQRHRRIRKGQLYPENGVHRDVSHEYLVRHGWVWIPTSQRRISFLHLTKEEMPTRGISIVALPAHFTCLVDGKIFDTFNPSNRARNVLGFYTKYPQEVLASLPGDGQMRLLSSLYPDAKLIAFPG